MSNITSSPLLPLFAIACVLLLLKAQALAAATASMRGNLKKFVNPEDAVWLGGRHVDVDDERVQRIFRAHRNDLENFLPFFAAGLLYLASGASTIAGAAYFLLFLVARFLHTFAYLNAMARARRNSFTLGWLTTIAIMVHMVIAILARGSA